ncbi:MAG: putative transporter [Bacteroidaceae bacterium]|nr:putative transporter [Bacteroidaceae bacterium]
MNWFVALFTETDSIAHILLVYAMVVSLGVFLGKRKMFGISLGVTFALFVGIACGHFGLTVPETTIVFVQNFGLILFVFCIGLQVGPSFFTSLKSGGITLNLLAISVIVLNIALLFVSYFLFFNTSDPTSLPMMVGALCGAILNTPALGAATEALSEVWTEDLDMPQIANGYACAYPLGVLGTFVGLIIVRLICKVKVEEEKEKLAQEENADPHRVPFRVTLEMSNYALNGKTLLEVKEMVGRDFVCSRIRQDGHVSIPTRDTVFHLGDEIYLSCAQTDAEAIIAFIGHSIDANWGKQDDCPMISRRIVVTQPEIDGKTIGSLHFSSMHGVTVTRVNRAGMDLFAALRLRLQLGDRVVVVGPEDAVQRVASRLGNSMKRLDTPNLLTIFVGIFLGIILGSVPMHFSGIPTPIKLGLAGGPLIVAILIGAFGYRLKLHTYTTASANLMLREIGLALFLASVGIKAGGSFVNTLLDGDGFKYMGCGCLISILPLVIVGCFARWKLKFNYLTLMGMLSGSCTNPSALAFSNQVAGNDAPAVAYSTVYPLTMFLRILTAQLIVLFLC